MSARSACIDAALAKRNLGVQVRPRIERLLDGVEDRERLRCCHSGCYVCVQDLLAILDEVERDHGRGPERDVTQPESP